MAPPQSMFVGEVYWTLKVLDYLPRVGKQATAVVVQCLAINPDGSVCGNIKTVKVHDVRSGATKSCGCLRKKKAPLNVVTKHGMSHTSEYGSWNGAQQRATNPNDKDYHRYGGAGRGMCEGFLVPANFFKAMGRKPGPDMDVDRIDSSLGYVCGSCDECLRSGWPMNCQWLDHAENARKANRDRYGKAA